MTEKTNDKRKKNVCCICGKPFSGYGNNAAPIEDGVCCDECNWNVVIPARLKVFTAKRSNDFNHSNDSGK